MYIESDFVNTATLDLQANRKMHNRILKYWPTTVRNGVTVMAPLNLYAGGAVQERHAHKRLYNILGINVEDLKKEKWVGIEKYYLYFNVVQGTYDDISNEQLTTYLEFQAPFTVENVPVVPPVVPPLLPVYDRSAWFTAEISYEPLFVKSDANVLSDASIIDAIKADPYIVEYSIEDEHILTALALLDVNEVIFEREFKVTYRGLTTVTFTSQTSVDNAATFVKECNIEFKFRRKPFISQSTYDVYLDTIRSAVYNSVNSFPNSVKLQLLEVYHDIVPFIDNEILYQGRYRLDGLLAMKSKEFNKTITARLKTGYKLKKLKFWKKLVTIVLEVIIYVLAFFFGIWVLILGAFFMRGLAMLVAKRDPAWAAYLNKSATRIGYVSAAVGIFNIVNSLATEIGKQTLTEAAKQALIDKGAEVSAENIVKQIAEASLVDVMNAAITDMSMDALQGALTSFMQAAWSSSTSFTLTNMLRGATIGFQIYSKIIDPPDEGIADMQEELNGQQKQMEDLAASGLKDKIDYTFTSPFYNIYDFNEIMQAVPFSMTQGKLDDAFNKYYDGITSKVTYRGYLG